MEQHGSVSGADTRYSNILAQDTSNSPSTRLHRLSPDTSKRQLAKVFNSPDGCYDSEGEPGPGGSFYGENRLAPKTDAHASVSRNHSRQHNAKESSMERRFAVVGLGLAALALVTAQPAAAQNEEAPAPKKITTVEGITEYRLENGLKVLLFPDASNPSVTVNLTVFVGSRHEGYGEAGMAHLLEHMLFKGTPDQPSIPKALTAHGAVFNGTTWLDRTNYYETLPAKGENLKFSLELEADRMVNSSIKAEDLASEMSVVRNEFERGENNALYVLNQRMMAVAYEWHNYGKSTIGNRADIERVPVENLRAFYRNYYQPDNAMLVVAGKFDPDNAMTLITENFGKIPRPKRKLKNTYTEEPAQDGQRLVTLRRVGDSAAVGVVYHIPAGPHPDFSAVTVLENILTAKPAGRLYKSLVESKKAAAVFGTAIALHDPGVLRIMAQVTKGNEPQVVLDTMQDSLLLVGKKGVTDEEVERSKRQLLTYFEQSVADSRQVAIQLSEWAAQGDWRLLFLYRDNIEKVTTENVNLAAAKYLRSNNSTVGMFIPTEKADRTTIPPTPDLAGIIGDYKGRKAAAVGEAFDVSPANIDRRTKHVALPSGIHAALLEKKTRGGIVQVRLTLRYGDEQNLQNLATACEFLPVVMARGTKKYNRQQLQDEFDKYQTRLSPSGDAGKMTFSLQVKRKNLIPVLKLLAEVLRNPTLPAEELDVLKSAQVSSIEQKLTDPQTLASVTVRRTLNNYPQNDPRYVPTNKEGIDRVKQVDRKLLKRLYDQYVGSNHGQLTIVGDFDADETLGLLDDVFADWKSTQSYDRLKRLNSKIKGGVTTIDTPDKESAFYFAATAFPLRDDHPDYPALVIGNFILGGGSLSSRLADRVRQKDGLSYGIGSGLQTMSLDHRTAFYIYASCKPENMPKLQTAVRQEIDRLLKDGVTEKELDIAKRGYIQRQQVSRTNDAQLAALLEANMLADRDMSFTAAIERKIGQLTAKQVAEAMRKHIKPNGLFIVEAGDFSKKPATKAGAAPPKTPKK
jgi:zinc protease